MDAELTPLMHDCLRATTAELAGEFGGVFSRETVARILVAINERERGCL